MPTTACRDIKISRQVSDMNMALMTTSQFARGLLLAALFATGCEREKSLPAGAVQFEGAGLALVPGDGWQQLRTGPYAALPDVCLPVLEGQGKVNGVIYVMSRKQFDGVTPTTVAAAFREEITARPKTVAGSFHDEPFIARSGLSGIHVSYEIAIQEDPTTMHIRTHFYIVWNKKGRCAYLNYIALPEEDSQAVHEMIGKTLVSL